MAAITRELVSRYREQVAKLPAAQAGMRKLTTLEKVARADAEGLPRISAATVSNKLRSLSSVLRFAAETLGCIPENPVVQGGFLKRASKAMAAERAAARQRKHYDEAELRTIFQSPIYQKEGWRPPRANFGEAWYWIPLLLYYTGARLEEVAQLAARDVTSHDGVPCLSILNTQGDEDGERGVKNHGSRRHIPLHPDLLKLGLIEYAGRVDAAGPLFPGLSRDRQGYFGTNFGKRWAEYLRKIACLESPANPAHGFRHTFKTLCRREDVEIEEDVQDAITGHAAKSVGRSYGEMPLRRMARDLERFPSAPLSSLL